ncbi:hypothetical protein BC835DRAFT_1405920 [Cytidiella melzeri]|nr:hypothetical protein BC835DRAFT_1405920 [Cytidiella melzeri]
MWERYDRDGADFSAGSDPQLALDNARARLANQCDNFAFLDAAQVAEVLGFSGSPEDEHASTAADVVQEEEALAALLDDLAPEDRDKDLEKSADPKWAPYSSKTEFLLDTIDNLPCMPISDALMKLFLLVSNEAGVRDVPSFYRLRKTQKELCACSGIPTVHCESARGNIFFVNDPRTLVAQDWTNLAIRPHIHVYPEIPDSSDPVSEVWHGEKWRETMNLDALSPMYNAHEKHYYVNKLTQLRNGEFIIPFRWVIYRKAVHAQSWAVAIGDNNVATVLPVQIMVAALDMDKNYFDLKADGKLPVWHESSLGYETAMPNPLRVVAKGAPLYSSFVDYFGNDVSGNRSKSWNKHLNSYMTHRNLPRSLLQQEYHTHFILTSTHASVAEQFSGFKNIVEQTHEEPVRVRDPMTDEDACFRLFVNTAPSDNPMQSEVSAHIGGAGNLFCCKCDAGGTGEEKESAEGFERLFKPGKSRTKESILDSLQTQFTLACGGVAQRIKDIQTATGMKDAYSQFWIDHLIERGKAMKAEDPSRSSEDIQTELCLWVTNHTADIYSGFLTLKGFDPTSDTPIEILHTILLGLVKYGWHGTHTSWNTVQKDLHARRLQATNIDGLSIHPIRSSYILQYANSLIGRQLKTLAQMTFFHVHDLISPLQFRMWHAIGELSALLWIPEIYEMNNYLDNVDIAVGNVLNTFAEIDPTKILKKIKLHLQSFNAIFRFCSIFSNHQAPSRDIAIQIAEQESMKHRLTGGLWLEQNSNTWTAAGWGVRDMLQKQPMLQRLIGWNFPADRDVGSCKLEPLKKGIKEQPSFMLSTTAVARCLNLTSYDEEDCFRGQWFVAQSKEECSVGSWVFASSSLDQNTAVGRVEEIIVSSVSASRCLVVIDLFQLAAARHEVFQMPFLQRRHGQRQRGAVFAKNVKFKFNAQHDCLRAGCQATGKRPQIQERLQTSIAETFIEHRHDTATD